MIVEIFLEVLKFKGDIMFAFILVVVAVVVVVGAFFYWYGKKSGSTPIKTIILDVVGESFNNDDGTSRQEIIEKYVKEGEPANLRFYDYKGSIACAVSVDGGQIGNLAKEKAKEMYDLVANDTKIGAGIKSVGLSNESNLYGVTLYIEIG